MKTLRRISTALFAGTSFAALVVGTIALTASPATARPPILLCGPTLLWVCSGPGGPDVLFAGTVCDKVLFEKQTGLTCVPYTG